MQSLTDLFTKDLQEKIAHLYEDKDKLKKENIILQQLLDELEMVQNAKNGEDLKAAIKFIGYNRNHQIPGRTQVFKMKEQLDVVDKVIKAEIAPNYLTRRFGIRQQAMMLGFYENKELELSSLIDTINVQTKLDRVLSSMDDIEKFEYLYLPISNPVKGRNFNGWEYDWTEREDKIALDLASNNCTWTVIDGDEGMYIIAGKHFVNRFAYIITNYPWETGEEQYKFD